jgi:hypothetical protein
MRAGAGDAWNAALREDVLRGVTKPHCACLARQEAGAPRLRCQNVASSSRPRACGASARGAAAWRDGAAPRRARGRRGARPRVRVAAPPRRSSQRHRRRRRRPRRPRASAAAAA